MLSPAIIYLYCCLVASLSHNHYLTPSLEKTSLLHQVYTRDWDSSTTDSQTAPQTTSRHALKMLNYDWIYIGEVKEGTDDTPHGIGIKVDSGGYIREGYWKDGKRHGRVRRIWVSILYWRVTLWWRKSRTETLSMKEGIVIIMVREHTTQKMETSIQAYGMEEKGKEKLATRTERSIRDTGSGNIIVVLRGMDKELYTLQMDKYSTKASGRRTSIKARSNTKLFTFVHQLCSILF